MVVMETVEITSGFRNDNGYGGGGDNNGGYGGDGKGMMMQVVILCT